MRRALERDGWKITHDPLRLRWGTTDLYVDLGAEQILAAEKGATRIAIEVKSFLGPSAVDDLEKALGQFVLYNDILAKTEPGRTLYLAVTESVFVDLFEEPIGALLIANGRVRLVAVDAESEEIRRWTPEKPTAS